MGAAHGHKHESTGGNNMTNEEYLGLYRHSLAHILAKAVIEIFGRENVQ